MKIKRRKHIALLAVIAILTVSLIPAESFVLASSEPEISILVEEMDEADISDLEYVAEEETEKQEEVNSLADAEETDIQSETESAAEEGDEEEKTETEPELTVTKEESDETENELISEEPTNIQNDVAFGELVSIKSLTATAAFVAEVDGVGYSAINEALAAWANGTTLKLSSNISSGITVPQGTKTLDLNGHNISKSGVAVKADGSNLTIIDSSGNAGKISNTSSSSGSAIDIKNGSLDLSDVTVESKFNGIGLDNSVANIYSGKISVTNQWKTCINVSNNSKLTIYDGTLRSANHMALYVVSGSEVEIEGGSFKGGISAGVTISGGYFDRDVSSLCAPNATCSASDDTSKGAYMVKTKIVHNHNDIDFTEWDQSNSLPNTAGSYYLTSDVTISSTWTVPQGTTNLCLDGHTIKGSGVENVIRVEAGCTLTVCDCKTTGTITGGRSYSGYRYGAGVYVTNGHFVLKSGTISGNSLTAGATGGGGVETEGEDAIFDMYGGTICNNEAGYGGGVYVRGGTFNLYDGIISNNKALSTDGGGVHVYGSASTFNMYGGSIINNTAKAGGGIGVSGGGTVNISSGTISGNTSTQVGGGITNRRTNASGDMNANISVSGTPVISGNIGAGATNNVYLFGGIVLNIGGVLESGAVIGVSMDRTGTFTNGLSGKGTENNFTSDDSELSIDLFEGEARLSKGVPGVTATGYEGNYDGNAHSITVSAPDGATVKYGEEEGSYTLTDNPSYINVGTYTVYYEVSKAGYNSVSGSATVKINPIDASITTAPKIKDILVYSGAEQVLIDEGAALGGTFYYAIGNDEASPDDAEYKTEIPKASDTGYYYIWYKVKGDANHNDISPQCVKATLAGEDWVTVSGVVCDSAKNPVGGAYVKLTQGNKVIDKVKSDIEGGYYFKVPKGLYNIVIKTDDATVTNMVDVSENTAKDVDLSNASTQSILDVVDSDKKIVVGGLSDEAESVRKDGNVPADKNVTVKLTVKSISESDTEGAQAIDNSAKDRNLEFLDLKVEKNVDLEVTELTETKNVLEFAIPCPYANKRGLTVYHYHGSEILTLTEISSKAEKADGTFYVDKENKMMYVYLSRFSTRAVGYKPYYSVKSNVSLGSFDGNVSVTLEKDGSSEKYELNDVSPDNISFTNIPKGNYNMTIKWEDGAVNTLPAIPISVK